MFQVTMGLLRLFSTHRRRGEPVGITGDTASYIRSRGFPMYDTYAVLIRLHIRLPVFSPVFNFWL